MTARGRLVVTDYLAQRFAHAYVQTMDPLRAAIAVGIGRNTDGSWDYKKASQHGEKLLQHPDVVSHLQYLAVKHSGEDPSLDFKTFSTLIAQMALVTFDNFFIWDNDLGDYVVKPFFMLTKAELMCLEDVSQYHALVGATKDAGAKKIKSISLSLIDRTKMLDMVAKVNGFYDDESRGRTSAEEIAAKLRETAALLSRTEGGVAQ